MRKEIRLLVEGFFDDEIFNQKNDINQDIQDIGDQYYDYHIGDIYYKDKEPYAICCGDKTEFNDNNPRFCLLKANKNNNYWSTTYNDEHYRKHHVPTPKILKYFKYNDFYITSENDIQYIDENGFYNTQILSQYKFNGKNFFPLFKDCIKQGDNLYIPAIDELQILFKHYILFDNKKLQDNLKINKNTYWSSTQNTLSKAFCLQWFNINNLSVHAVLKGIKLNYILFLKIN